MSIRLSMKVIRGILALGKPGVADVVNFPVDRKEMRKRGVYYKDVDEANRALEWAAAVHLKQTGKHPKPRHNRPEAIYSYDLPVFDDD